MMATKSGPPQQIFVATMLDDGTISLEIPGSAEHSRRKLDTSFGLDAAIRNELERQAMERRSAEIEAANKLAQQQHAQHKSNVEYIAEYHPMLLSCIEPGAKPSARAQDILSRKLGPAIVRSMQERGELRILVKSPPRPEYKPPEFSHEDVGV